MSSHLPPFYADAIFYLHYASHDFQPILPFKLSSELFKLDSHNKRLRIDGIQTRVTWRRAGALPLDHDAPIIM